MEASEKSLLSSIVRLTWRPLVLALSVELTHGRTPFLPHVKDDLLLSSSPHSSPRFPLFLQGLRVFCLSHTEKLLSEEGSRR